MAYVVAEPCADVLDQACVEECPVDCIYQGDRMMYIHPEECVDCAACEVVCPVEAIYFEDDVPDKWSAYTGANAEFFTEIGSPGGAITVGKLGHDVEPVLSLPRDAGRRSPAPDAPQSPVPPAAEKPPSR